MFVDSLCKLSAAQQITADAASGNTYDAGNVTPKRDLGAGEPMCVVVALTAVGTNTGSAKIQVIMSASANLGTPTIVGETDVAAGDLVAGKRVVIAIGEGPTVLRYWGVYYDITGTVDFTVDAYLMPRRMANRDPQTYARGYTVS